MPMVTRARRRVGRAITWMAALLWTPAAAVACPNCALGRQVRAEVFSADSLRLGWRGFLPLLILAALAPAAHRLGRPKRRGVRGG
jgi:hypothetical protein